MAWFSLFKKTPLATTRRQRSSILGFIGLMVFSIIIGSLSPLTAHAAWPSDAFTPDQEATSYSYYVALGGCIQNNMYGDFNSTVAENGNANPSEWFDDYSAYGYIYPNGQKTDCKAIASDALALWGWTNSEDFLTAIKYTYTANTNTGTPSYHGTADGATRIKDFQAAVKAEIYGGATPSLSAQATYDIDFGGFTQNGGSCSATDLGLYSSLNSTQKSYVDAGTSATSYGGGRTTNGTTYVKIPVVDPTTGASADHGYTFKTTNSVGITSSSTTDHVTLYGYQATAQTATCEELVAGIQKNATTYSQWIISHKTKDTQPPAACVSGSTDPACTTTQPTCGSTIQGIGWILCPVFTALGGFDDGMWNFVSGLLDVSPLQQVNDQGQTTTTYLAWKTFQSIANVVLVISFLIIIFSQLTGQGVTNYGVKKTLPRLIIVAVLINISFIVMQISVDLANIIGKSLYDLINGIVGNPTPPSWGNLLTTILGLGTGIYVGAAAIAIAPEAAIMILIPGALAAVIGFLAAALTLMFRQAIIPILAILAPLAFAAYLLPNTKPLFDRWWKLFSSMLLLYPLAAVLFAGVKLSANLISAGHHWWETLTALIVMGAPLFMLPFLARQSGSFLGKVNSGVKGLAGRVQKPVGSWADSRRKNALARSDASTPGRRNIGKRIRQGFQTRAANREIRTEAYNAQRSANFNEEVAATGGASIGNVKGSAANAYVRGVGSRAKAEELKQATGPLAEELAHVKANPTPGYIGNEVDDFLATRAVDTTRSTAERSAALHQLGSMGRDQVLRDLATHPNIDKTAHQEAIAASAGPLNSKAPDLVKGPDGAFQNVTGEQMAGFSADTAAAHMKYLEQLHTQATAPGATPAQIAAFDTASASFNSAVEDITLSASLQGTFNSKNGQKITSTISGASPAFQAYAASSLTGLAAIQADGKIR